MSDRLTDEDDILMLWQSNFGYIDEDIRDRFLDSDIVEELCYFNLDLIQEAMLKGKARLREILDYARSNDYIFSKTTKESVGRIETRLRGGAYLLENRIFAVRKDRKTNEWQAWEFDRIKRDYKRPFFSADENRIINLLDENCRLTFAMAEKFSIETGICCHCGRYLSAKKSVARGMGPVCKKHYH